MSNPANMGTLVGRLARDPKFFENKDGSKKVLFTVYADRNYTTGNGERPSDAIPVEAFVSNQKPGHGAYDHVHQGDLVALVYSLQAQTFERNNERVYETKIVIDEIKFLESRQVTQARLADRVAKLEAANGAAKVAPSAQVQEVLPNVQPVQQTVQAAQQPAFVGANGVLLEEPPF